MEKLNNKINIDGKEYELGGGDAKLVASYTFDLEETDSGLFEYFSETNPINIKENTTFLIDIKIGDVFPSQMITIGKSIKQYGSIDIVSQMFKLPPSNTNNNKYDWVECVLCYSSVGNMLSISVINYDFDFNAISWITIDNFTVNFYELPFTLGGNE